MDAASLVVLLLMLMRGKGEQAVQPKQKLTMRVRNDAVADRVLKQLEATGTIDTMSFDGRSLSVVWRPLSEGAAQAALPSDGVSQVVRRNLR